MIAFLIYDKPSDFQIMKVKFFTLVIILLGPEGSGLFAYCFLWLIIPPDTEEESNEGNTPPNS